MSSLGPPGQNLLSAFKAMQVGSIGETLLALMIPRQQGAGMDAALHLHTQTKLRVLSTLIAQPASHLVPWWVGS
jgi:hypothetical protein